MISALVLVAVTQTSLSPSKLVSETFARYYNAKSVTGTIVLTQSVAGQAGKITTQLQLVRPNLLFLKQQKSTGEGRVSSVIADGKQFVYDEPYKGEGKRNKVYERMVLTDEKGRILQKLTLMDAYGAATRSLEDRSAPLDIVINRQSDLKAIILQLVNLKYAGETDLNGEKVRVVQGDWKEYGDAPISGQFQMAITPQSDLRFYEIRENVSFGSSIGVHQVLSQWTVNLKVDGDPDMSLFKIVN